MHPNLENSFYVFFFLNEMVHYQMVFWVKYLRYTESLCYTLISNTTFKDTPVGYMDGTNYIEVTIENCRLFLYFSSYFYLF